MPERLKHLFDNDTHPLVKGFVGMVGAGTTYAADKLTWLEPVIKGICFYGGAVVVLLTITSLSLDVARKGMDFYRKWKNRNNP